MGAGAAILTTLRVLGVIAALAVVGLGAWGMLYHARKLQWTLTNRADIIMVHDVEVRGSVLLDAVNIPQDKEDAWQAFFDAVVNSQTRIWIAIAAVRTFTPSMGRLKLTPSRAASPLSP